MMMMMMQMWMLLSQDDTTAGDIEHDMEIDREESRSPQPQAVLPSVN